MPVLRWAGRADNGALAMANGSSNGERAASLTTLTRTDSKDCARAVSGLTALAVSEAEAFD